MSRLLLVLVVLGLAFAARYRLGTPISEELAAQYDLRPVVLPDGRGLPPGEGKVEEGRRIYAEKCASCHGANGEGYPFNRLISEPFPITPDTEPVEYAIGNYWQYPTTLFDYIRRAMPFGQGGTLSNEEVYHLVAYLLYMNGIIDAGTPVNQKTLPQIRMPARELLELDPETRRRFHWLTLP
ncbi:c-type cytochrome [Thermus thermophilus]|uniref:c-type cytochrome n=1 Tax=Thermus thermophilus TaxID=274 RepID=UPI001A9CB06F|nr:cytochrome c [Thermus thermophilus]